MWLTVLKVLLIAWLVIGVVILITGAIRRSRANRGDVNWSRRTRRQPSHTGSVYGHLPQTPLPEWVDWEDNDLETQEGERTE